MAQWQPAQVRTASFQPRAASPISYANACASRSAPNATISAIEISLL